MDADDCVRTKIQTRDWTGLRAHILPALILVTPLQPSGTMLNSFKENVLTKLAGATQSVSFLDHKTAEHSFLDSVCS